MVPFSSIPRPEYPRPDRQRGRIEGNDWLNLNGPWQFRFDPQRVGIDEKWFSPDGPEWREQIIVPFCWESLAAWGEGEAAGNDNYFSTRVFLNPTEVTRANHRDAPRYEVGWYRRLVALPDNLHWRKRRSVLTIGAADFATDCWCNGIHVGHHEGGYVPIEMDLTDAVVLGADAKKYALLVIRVEDPMDNAQQPVGKQWRWYTTTSGIWQTVFIEPIPYEYIHHFQVKTDIDAAIAHFEVFCGGVTNTHSVAVEITPPKAPPHRIILKVENGVARGDAEIDPLTLWDPSDPQLYQVAYRLLADEVELDVVRGYFGMRKIGTVSSNGADAPAMLSLNNKPIYLRGALYQSYHPEGVYTAGNARTLYRDIAYARSVGFDFLRIHIKLDDPLVLYYADTLGILIMQDFPNFGEGGDTPLGRKRFEEMMLKGFERDFNHPSIIAWCLFNETWGFGGQTELMKLIHPSTGKPPTKQEIQKVLNQDAFKWVHLMWQMAKKIDPTRLIEDMSVVVWEHLTAYGHVDTDINSWHFYIDDYAKAKAHVEDVVAKTYRGSSFNYVEGYQQSGAPLINSEYGGVGALDGDRDISWTFKFLTNELRRHNQLSAYIFTELHDVEWEYNGFLNYDRTPKDFGYHPTLVNQGDVLPINAAPISRCFPGDIIDIEISTAHFSRKRRENVSLQWFFWGIDSLGTIHPALERGSMPIRFPQYKVESALRLQVKLPAETMLCTVAFSAITPDGNVFAENYVQQFVSNGKPPLREDRGNTLVLRRRVHEWDECFWSGSSNSKEESEKTGSCYGKGSGHFSWTFEDLAIRELGKARRLRLLCEVSAHRDGNPQSDGHRFPTNFELHANGLLSHRALLPNHPHDTRGSLSYLRGGKGAYGYLMNATIEGDLLKKIAETATQTGKIAFRCSVPEADPPHGGLTVYEADCGRFPVGPTVVIEWEHK